MNEHEICSNAIKTFGWDNQRIKLLEEMGELIRAVCKFELGQCSVEHVAEEVADVEIMLEQLKQYYQIRGEVKTFRGRKLERLLDIIKSGKTTLTDDEKGLARCFIAAGTPWAARDNDGDLWVYGEKPLRGDGDFVVSDSCSLYRIPNLPAITRKNSPVDLRELI